MDFFASQDAAKRNTGRLILLFVLAIVSLVVITNLLVLLIFGAAASGSTTGSQFQSLQFDLQLVMIISGAVIGIVLLGSLYKISSLSGGGARVAEMMHGQLLVHGDNSLQEQRVLNVVEEMAIASGTPVPPVYLMEEAGINAFAAGYSPGDAVIGITRGAIETLSRDQLQGVIAHEFSHILHGDMRINIRLIGVLHGILLLGIIGYHLLRGGAYSRRSRSSGGIVALGLGLVVVGYTGTFFGNLIKAAVSRQREYLADASAVQFTRNPEGIGGALMQIAQHSQHSYLKNPASNEISHALFEEASYSALSAMYATHPPLEKRIAAILPNWDGSYALIEATQPASEQPTEEPAGEGAAAVAKEKFAAILSGTAGVVLAGHMGETIIKQTGTPAAENLQQAEALLVAMPDSLLAAAHDPSAARALIYWLVLAMPDASGNTEVAEGSVTDQASTVFRQQLTHLQESADVGVYDELQALLSAKLDIPAQLRLPLVEIAMPSLRQLSKRQYGIFRSNFAALIAMDKRLELFEWSLQKIVFHSLDVVFEHRKPSRLGRKELRKSSSAVATLLGVLAQAQKQQGITAQEAYTQGAASLSLVEPMPDRDILSLERLSGALEQLQALKPLQKPALLKACAATITADKAIQVIELELFRAIAVILECPMPPLKIDEQ